MPGVTVTVTNTSTNLVRSVVTGAEGRYAIPSLPPGRYELRAELPASSRPAARPRSDGRRAPGAQHHPAGRRARRRSRPGAIAGHQHVDVGAELPGRVRRDRAAAAERAQLHRPRAAAARRQSLPASRRRLGRGARSRDERQRSGSARQRLPARRHPAERFHQRTGRQRGRDVARHRDDPRVPRRDQRLQRRVRPQFRRPDHRADASRARTGSRGSAFEFHRNDAMDARNFFDADEQTGLPSQSVRRHRRRSVSARSRVLLLRL